MRENDPEARGQNKKKEDEAKIVFRNECVKVKWRTQGL